MWEVMGEGMLTSTNKWACDSLGDVVGKIRFGSPDPGRRGGGWPGVTRVVAAQREEGARY